MKVLILHQHFKIPQEGGAIRSYYLAKALEEHGMKPVVITAHNQKRYEVKTVDGIEVHYLPVAYDNSFGFIARSVAFLRFAWKSSRLASKIPGVQLCYAISVPLTVGLSAMWIKKLSKVPYIFEVGDLWPDAPVQMGFVNNYFFRKFLYSLERSIYEGAESIVALSPAIKSAIEEKVPGRKVHMIPNMADCEFFVPEEKDNGTTQKFGTSGKFVVSYIGALGIANGLDYFLECAHASRKAKLPIQFMLCGEGAWLDRLKRNAEQLELSNLTFVDFQTRAGVKELLNITDAVFVCYKDYPILETGSPNKFFDGLAAGKLIIINFGGWIKKVISESQCGVALDPKEPNDFIRKIKPFVDDGELLKRFQKASRELGEREYSRVLLSKAFVSLFSDTKLPLSQ